MLHDEIRAPQISESDPKAAELHEEMLFDSEFVDPPRPLSDEEMAWAREVIEAYEREQASSRPTA
jgi:hypothetical protein